MFNGSCEFNNNINEELTKICDWLNVNKLVLNVDKNKATIFNKMKVEKGVLLINGSIIEYVNIYTFILQKGHNNTRQNNALRPILSITNLNY